MIMAKPKAVKYEEIEVSKIRKSPLHFTREIDPEKFKRLCENIDDAGGINNPITVLRKKDGKGFEYIVGERRFKAARKLGLRTIPCLIKTKDDLDARQESICENLDREDLSPAVQDAALRELVDIKKQQLERDRHDLPDPARSKSSKVGQPEKVENTAIREVASNRGISTRTVMRAVAMENLIKDAAKAYEKEQISKRQADLLSRMSPEDQEVELQLMLNETQEDTEERLKEARRRPTPPLPPGEKGTHNVNPALRLFDKIIVLSRDLEAYAKKLREELTEESVAAIKDLDRDDIVSCNQALSLLLDDISVVAAWKPRSRQ
jgi:ParB-like chromosome segregation protein Spo0J